MRTHPTNAIRARRLLTVAGAASLALTLTTSTRAEERSDLDLQPADFTPDEPIAIRVDSLKPGTAGSNVSVTIANRTRRDVEAVVDCTLYDADRDDLGVATSVAVRVAADERKSTVVTGAEAAKFAECKVRDAK